MKTYEEFVNEAKELSKDDIEKLLKQWTSAEYKFNSDGSVDVFGDVNILNFKGKILPFKFKRIYGNFDCSNNKLTSLENSPEQVANFYCDYNNLINLVGSPKIVEDFYCTNNKLTTLDGAPKNVNGTFSCRLNKITSLKGSPEYVKDAFICSDNKLLTSLDGAPKKANEWYSSFSKIKFSKYDVQKVCDVNGIIKL